VTDVSKIAAYQAEVEEAKKPDTFNLLETIQGTAYPEDSAVVFTNVNAVLRLIEVREALNEFRLANEDSRGITGYANQDEYDALEEQESAVREEIRASALTFHLKGLSPSLVEAIAKEKRAKGKEKYEGLTDQEKDQAIIVDIENALIAQATRKVVNAEGAVNEDVDLPTIEKIRDILPEPEFDKIRVALNNVQFKAVLFDEEIDAGFPG
jgi:hypothetical protein